MATRRKLLALLLVTTAPARPSVLRAQSAAANWPARPVRYIEPFGPGSGSDTASRILCTEMAEITGQQFIVENRTGGGGTIGVTAVARAAPDGYTIGLNGIATLVTAPLLHPRLPFDPARDFTLLCGQWRQPAMLVANNDVPVRSIPEFIELLRRNPNRYTYGHGGLGSTPHLSMEHFKTRAGVSLEGVPYTGPQALLDLAAGRLPFAAVLFAGGIAGVRDGRYRALAVTSRERYPYAEDIPSLSETLPGFDVTSWAITAGPAGLPPALSERMQGVSREALRRPVLLDRFRQAGIAPWTATPAEIATYTAEQIAMLGPIIRASGARIE